MSKVFISYSHGDGDEAWKDRVVRQLRVLQGIGLEIWDDRKIGAGGDWRAEIEAAIAQCDVAVLLVSANFLTSDFILGQEVPALLQRRQEEGIRVVPLVLSPCPWTRIAWLSSIQARPKDGKALSGMSEHDAETALAALAEEIHDLGKAPPPAQVAAALGTFAQPPAAGRNVAVAAGGIAIGGDNNGINNTGTMNIFTGVDMRKKSR